MLVIEQRLLPFEYEEVPIRTAAEMTVAIADMVVRGAGCIGVSAGYGMYLAALEGRNLSGAEADESPFDRPAPCSRRAVRRP